MAGTLIAYQGHRAQRVTARRSRGWAADVSVVYFPLAVFPEGFDFSTPKPGDVLAELDPVIPSLAAIKQARREGRPTTGSGGPSGGGLRLNFAGALVMAEAQAEEWQVVLHPLFVVRVERIRGEPGTPAMVQVTLTDERYLWPRGFMRRWSFNRIKANGRPALDSLKAGAKPYHLGEIAEQVALSLPRSPALAAFPADWAKNASQREFQPFSAAVSALAEVVREGGAEAPCLLLDGSLGLYRAGEGLAGLAEAPDKPNTLPFPDALRLSRNLTGQKFAIEAQHPEDFILVRGGKRVMSVVLDEWEPVLGIGEDFYALTEDLVKRLTGGRFGLRWLAKFVVMPPAYQNAADLPESVAELFRKQAWRLYRLPGAVVEGEERLRAVDAIRGTGEGGAMTEARRGEIQGRAGKVAERGGGEAQEGPNAHLLPLLPRAETVAGKRLPVTVERFGFATRQKALAGDGSAAIKKLAAEKKIMADLRRGIFAAIGKKGEGGLGAFAGGVGSASGPAGRFPGLGAAGLLPGETPLPGQGLFDSQFRAALTTARTVDGYKKADANLGGQYDSAYKRALSLADKANGTTRAGVYSLAQQALELEKRLKAEAGGKSLSDALKDPKFRGAVGAFKDKVKEALDAFAKAEEQAERVRSVTGGRGFVPSGALVAHFVENRAPHFSVEEVLSEDGGTVTKQTARTFKPFRDEGARVVSAESGIILTSALAGHIAKEGVPTAEASHFVPKPVRVTFGTTVRPAFLPAGTKHAGTTTRAGVKLDAGPDAVTWYHRAYQRDGTAGKVIPMDAIPTGEGVVIHRPDLVELQPLEGNSNVAELDRAADDVALARFRTPERVDSEVVLLARPLAVQTNGTVAAVEWRSRDTPAPGTGFTTSVHVGREANLAPLSTRTRPKGQVSRPYMDNVKREGLE